MKLLAVFLVCFATSGYFAEEIVPVKTGNGPTPKPGGQRRKDPTADLPDLSRDELLAILDLIEKSGDSSTPEARTVPPRYPSSTSKPLYPILPGEKPHEPTGPSDSGGAYGSTVAPRNSPTAGPHDEFETQTPPNYPAPIAPPSSATPKPKKSFFDKIFRGFLKIVAPQAAVSGVSTTASAGTFLNSFVQQLQSVQQASNQQNRMSSPASTGAILNSLLQRLQHQNSDGSQFVTNLVQTLQANQAANSPSAAGAAGAGAAGAGAAAAGAAANGGAASPSRSGSSAEQIFSSLLKSVTQSGPQQAQQASGLTFAELLQREIINRNIGSSPPSGQKSATDLIFDGFKQVLQQSVGKP